MWLRVAVPFSAKSSTPVLVGRGLTSRPETMLPFSVTALAGTASFLAAYGIELEVIGMAPADKAGRQTGS